MKQYKKYLVLPTDQFDPNNFSSVDDDVLRINEKTHNLTAVFKAEMIVSFFKDHSLQNDWVKANPELTELLTSGALFSGSIEELFDSCNNNQVFSQGLENYLRERFA